MPSTFNSLSLLTLEGFRRLLFTRLTANLTLQCSNESSVTYRNIKILFISPKIARNSETVSYQREIGESEQMWRTLRTGLAHG